MNPVGQWLLEHPLAPVEVDCATTVMLKIIDGKCKMKPDEKQVMTTLYDAVSHLPGRLFETEGLHALIARSRGELSEAQRLAIYEKRLLAETRLSRPVMKTFKARIRRDGLFAACGSLQVSAEAE